MSINKPYKVIKNQYLIRVFTFLALSLIFLGVPIANAERGAESLQSSPPISDTTQKSSIGTPSTEELISQRTAMYSNLRNTSTSTPATSTSTPNTTINLPKPPQTSINSDNSSTNLTLPAPLPNEPTQPTPLNASATSNENESETHNPVLSTQPLPPQSTPQNPTVLNTQTNTPLLNNEQQNLISNKTLTVASYQNLKKLLIGVGIVSTTILVLKSNTSKIRQYIKKRQRINGSDQISDDVVKVQDFNIAPSSMAHIWAQSGSILENKLVPPLKLISPGKEESQRIVRKTTVYTLPRPVLATNYEFAFSRSFASPVRQRATF